MEVNKYPDGTSYVNKTVLGQQVFRINSYEDLWHLNQFVDAFHSQYDSLTVNMRPNIIIPNLPDAQADRRFKEGESFGLKLVLKFLAGLDANFTIFHPHNAEVVEMAFEILGKKVEILDNSDFISKVLKDLAYEHNSPADIELLQQDLILFSSDAGGFKPLMKLADKLNWRGEVYGASKSRKYEEGESKLVQIIDRQDFEGKDILIIDDMSLYGGTFVGLAKMLKERNCGKLYLAVSHLTVPKPNPELFGLFTTVFTTNSKGLNYLVPGKDYGEVPKNLKVINLF
jgi:ribose-phosphate pyrophosphokinase